MKKYIGILIMAGLCGAAQASTIAPSADAWVYDTAQDLNTGGNIELRVGYDLANARQNRAFMKFDLSGIDSGLIITNAKVHVYVASGGSSLDLGLYEVADDTWTEMGVTWSNQPSYGSLAKYNGSVSVGWVEIDVTASVSNTFENASDDLWSVVFKSASELTDGSRVTSFRSKEAAGFEPYLEVDTIPAPVIAVLEADAWVYDTDPDLNTGGNIELRVGYSVANTRMSRSFMKFDLSAFDSGIVVTNAKLHVHVASGGSALDLGFYEVADDTWTEMGLTWNNQPGYGSLATYNGSVVGTPTWIVIDVLASVSNTIANASDDLWSVMLKSAAESTDGSNVASLRSKEAAGLEPYLEIGWEPAFKIATIVGLSPTNNMVRLVIDASGPGHRYYPKTTTDLVGVPWGSVEHSDDGVNPSYVTNLNYATSEGTNKVIYVDATGAAAFFGIGEE